VDKLTWNGWESFPETSNLVPNSISIQTTTNMWLERIHLSSYEANADFSKSLKL